MISFLRGKILDKKEGFVIVLVRDVGYKVGVNSTFWAELNQGDGVDMYTHHHVKEDASDLYGFRSMDELELFQMLLSISGIGPKSAVNVLSISSPAEIKDSIARGDSSLLQKVSGIGKKTAERVVLELQEKVGSLGTDLNSATGGISTSSADEMDALITLGYSLQQAREALKKVDSSITDSGERIKEALKSL